MPTYFVGEAQHRVDHPPLFAAREGKRLLTFSASFVEELLTTAEDRVPVHLDEIASKLSRDSAPAYQLPGFLLPPKIVLYNPDNLRGVAALPYVVALVNTTFFGIPAHYLKHTCFAELEHEPPPTPSAPRPAAPPSGPPPGRTPARGIPRGARRPGRRGPPRRGPPARRRGPPRR
ncbi:MAG: hypothetical protein KDD82_22135 [Planctomycetes bacterium]|nr:hypothetical protein [Planctomycetota bacterium]